MKRCKTCRHWIPTTFYKYYGAINTGRCNKIRNELDIELITGWDGGYVDYVETRGNFGCVLYKPKIYFIKFKSKLVK